MLKPISNSIAVVSNRIHWLLLICVALFVNGCNGLGQTNSQWSSTSPQTSSLTEVKPGLAATEDSRKATEEADEAVFRGQSPSNSMDTYSPGSNSFTRRPMAVSGSSGGTRVAQIPRDAGTVGNGGGANFGGGPPIGGVNDGGGPGGPITGTPVFGEEDGVLFGGAFSPSSRLTRADLEVLVEEDRTGRFMAGVGVNSEAGITGQFIIDERNFNIRQIPTSFHEFMNGGFRGGGQGFRLEAIPGDLVQRYLVDFTEPYLFDTWISFGISGFYYDRRFIDWDETRKGGRVRFGYNLTPDLSIGASGRLEQVNLRNPRTLSVPELNAALGNSNLFGARFTLIHDTRDVPFAPTEGHYIELSYEQTFGTFDYPKAEIDYRKHFLLWERADRSGRHTLSYNFRFGYTGPQTPIFENYFAGGFSTLRGFDYRGASPTVNGVRVGGEFRFLGSVQYMFPLTADDMLRGVVFCDFGTVEEKTSIDGRDYRVAPGFGLRVSIPALGPAPLALDFAVPVAHEDTDRIQNFSFFFGFNRQ